MSSLRGDLRQTSRGVVGTVYGFNTSMPPVEIAALVETLTFKSAFTFANPSTVSPTIIFCYLSLLIVSQRQGTFRNKVFVHLAQTQWFSNARDEGTGPLAAAFNPIPLETFAFMATTVSHLPFLLYIVILMPIYRLSVL